MKKSEKKAIGLSLIICGAMVLIFTFLLFCVVQAAPAHYCEKWGGKLYTDDNCYLTADMTKCVDSQGSLRDASRTLNLPYFNLTGVS